MKAVQFCQDNWVVIVPVLAAVWSEIMSLNPNWKSNGIIQLIGNLIFKPKV